MAETNSEYVIVTGFGPFGTHLINASWESVKLLPDRIDNGIQIIKQEVPVQYSDVETKVPQLWKQHNPLLVIHVGVSGEARKVTIEKCANRNGYEKCDSAGLTHPTGKACLTGDDCIFTGIDVDAVCNRLNNSGKVKACLSENAGRYLCEFIYYTSLNVDPSRALFVHVPPLDRPYSAKELSEGLLEIIQCALEQKFSTNEECICTTAV